MSPSETLEQLRDALAGRYLLEREIGRGGMAVVYLAYDVRHRRAVVVKVLHAELSAAVGAARFQREIEIVARLTHPHILPLYDSGEAAGALFFVMPYVEGDSLRRQLDREGALPLHEACRIAVTIACTLDYAHRHGVVHRDIKPENILLEENEPIIADFGIARAITDVADGRGITETGLMVGTAAYMSPEQASGEIALDGRSDLYSLGCVLYEMLAGRPPFAGATTPEVIARRFTAPPPTFAAVGTFVPDAVERVVTRALALAPAERFQRGDDFAAALRDAVANAPAVSAPRATGSGSHSRRPRVAAAAAAAAILLGAAGARWIWQRHTPATPASPTVVAVLPFSMRGNPEMAYLGGGMVSLLSTALDGTSELRSADSRALLGYLAQQHVESVDPAEGEQIAARFGASLYVLGDIVDVGGRLRMDATLYDARRGATAVGQANVEGDSTQIFGMVDQLAEQLLAERDGGPGSRLTAVAGVTTSSLPALKQYIRGESEFRAGRFVPAVDAFQHAVAIDSTFALAYYRLSIAAEWNVQPDVAQTAAAHAAMLTGHLSPHDSLLLHALLAHRDGQAAEAERLYRTIVRSYPDDVEAWFQLGEVLFHDDQLRGRSFTSSREAWERVLAFDPDHVASLLHLARVAAVENRRSELDSLASRVQTLIPDGDRLLEILTLRAGQLRDAPAMQHVLALARGASDIALMQATLAAIAWGDNEAFARQLAGRLTDQTRPLAVQAYGHLDLAHLALMHGRLGLARAELAAAEPLAPHGTEFRALIELAPFLPPEPARLRTAREALSRLDLPDSAEATWNGFLSPNRGIHRVVRAYLLGLMSAREDSGAAERYELELSRAHGAPQVQRLAHDMALAVHAERARARGRAPDALRALGELQLASYYELQIPSPFWSQARQRFVLAEALAAAGRDEEALRWYDSFAHVSSFDGIYDAPARFRRGEIYERLGQRIKARQEYSRFIDLWKDCDPELRPQLLEAERRVARLE